jgi:hypothetical protein
MESTHYIVECVWYTWTVYHLVPKMYDYKDLFYRRDKVMYKDNFLDIQSKVYERTSSTQTVNVVDFNTYFKYIVPKEPVSVVAFKMPADAYVQTSKRLKV